VAFQANQPDVSVRRSGSQDMAETFPSEFVSGNYFATFGIQPFAGRMLTPQDDTVGAPPALVMSYRAWQERYGLDPSIVGVPLAIIAGHLMTGKLYGVARIQSPGAVGSGRSAGPVRLHCGASCRPVARPPLSL
jgi:putative ABC transport system permease protein